MFLISKSPLAPLCKRGEVEAPFYKGKYTLNSPFYKGGLRGIFFVELDMTLMLS
jgi:hypothetical protein